MLVMPVQIPLGASEGSKPQRVREGSKPHCDSTMLSKYRPISNLPFIGKIIEKVVFNQLNNYLNSNGYLDNFQSGFRAHHSIETALIKIINYIRFNSDSGKISVLVLLDLSAAFDTVDHNILRETGKLGRAFWDGTQMVQAILRRERLLCEYRRAFSKSKWTSKTCGVPQGSILAPLLFSLYMLPLSNNFIIFLIPCFYCCDYYYF